MADDYELVIQQGRGIRHCWRDLWQYREFFYFLSWRDVSSHTNIDENWLYPSLSGMRN